MLTTSIEFEEFVKKRAIVDHGLPQFFRAGLASLPPQRERTSGSVILNDHRMVNREVVRTPIEVFERVATRG